MKLIRIAASVLAAAFFLLMASTMPALAVTQSGTDLPTTYFAAFAPLFGMSDIPRSGVMSILVHDGTISGTYSGTSVGPDYLDNRRVPVTGSVSENDYVQLFIGGAITLRGTIHPNGEISGTLSENGRLYEFAAAPHPNAY
jgi:hypothetical protein